jgi:hypothetical protein
MDKKNIAYILIGGGVAVAIYYFYRKSQDTASANSLGAGAPDTRGVWAADDDATYNKMRNKVKAQKDKIDGEQALGWIDPLVKQDYESGPNATHNINGMASKAGAFLAVMEAVNANAQGQFTGNQSGGGKQLFPDSLFSSIWPDFNTLKVKYGAL